MGISTCSSQTYQGLEIKQLRDPARRPMFEEYLDHSGICHVPWDVDVNTHALWLQQVVQDTMKQALPLKKDLPRSSYVPVPEAAWRIRQNKQHLKKRTADRKVGFLTAVLQLVLHFPVEASHQRAEDRTFASLGEQVRQNKA